MKVSPLINEIWIYTKLIFKNWYILLLLILDAIAVIVQFFIPAVKLPTIIYVFIVIICFFIAGFIVFRENQKKYYETISTYEKNIKLLLNDNPDLPNNLLLEEFCPNLHIEFIEGSEYSYSQRETNNNIFDEDEPYLPLEKIRLNIRVTNTGNTELQILGINSNLFGFDCFGNYPITASSEKIFTGSNNEVKYPIVIQPTSILLFTIESKIYFYHVASDLLLAASLREIIKESNFEKVVIIFIKTIYPKDGSLHDFNVKLNFSTRPFFDYLFDFWEANGRSDLVRIAKGN